mmetsp:Transcript_9576/g.14417  ORF Transcript_9576/g.14417 Transcript_9576/m.14417 type:complete len:258 (+) Transcript_9576:174-947(+)
MSNYGQQPPEFLNSMPQVSPAMLNYGVETTSNMLKKQRDIYMPGMSNFWNSLKIYFMVSNTYVVKKMPIVLFPFQTKTWARVGEDDMSVSYSQEQVSTHKWLPPKYDVNAPDLYIPTMAFVTYILLVGYVKGTSNKFTPEVLIQAVWSCVLLQLCEAGIMKLGLGMMQANLPFLDLIAYTGYKYVGICVATISLIFGSTIYFLACLYIGVSIAFFMLKSIASAVPTTAVSSSGPPRHLVILAFAVLQFLVTILLCYF